MRAFLKDILDDVVPGAAACACLMAMFMALVLAANALSAEAACRSVELAVGVPCDGRPLYYAYYAQATCAAAAWGSWCLGKRLWRVCSGAGWSEPPA